MRPSRAPSAALLACLLLATLPLDGAAQPFTPQDDPSLPRLLAEVERIAASGDGTVGVAAVELESGRAVHLNGDVPFPMASTYKVPIAVQLLTRVERGELRLEEQAELTPEDLHPGSGTLTRLFDDPGVALSLTNLLELMLLISDNSATDLVLQAAGGPAAVTARMRELGVEGLRVDRPTSVLIGDFSGVSVPEDGRISQERFRELSREVTPERRREARRAFATDPRDTATPAAMARLLQLVWQRRALGEESTALLLDAMSRVETGEGRIRGMLPPRVGVAHKTGTIGGTTNDVGYLELPDGGRVALVVFVKDSERPVPERERVIAQIARAVYDYFAFVPARVEAAVGGLP